MSYIMKMIKHKNKQQIIENRINGIKNELE